MLFPNLGQYSLTVSNNILEVYATGAWDVGMAKILTDEMAPIARQFEQRPWAAIVDCRRWVMSTPECQGIVREGIIDNIRNGLKRAAYVVDTNHIKHAQLERTHPQMKSDDPILKAYEREYFTNYLDAIKWHREEGYQP